jgi:predicted PurR-regulated permease PerM
MVASSGTPSPPATLPPRLRFTNRSVATVVVIAVGALWALDLLGQGGRVLGWLLVACIGAGLLHPAVTGLARRMPRALALVIVVVVTLGAIGGLVYSGIDDIRTQAERLEEAAPDAARRIERRDDGIGEAATEFELTRRVREFVDDLPERLQGGDAPEALRAAATRGVAFFATAMLTLFLLIHGRRLLDAGLRQIHDVERRRRTSLVVFGGAARAWRYLVLTLARAVLAGAFGLAVASAIDLPGQTILALWVAVWSIVPLVGVAAGSVPTVLLTFTVDPARVPWVVALFVGYQVVEVLVLQRRLERASVHIGPFVTLVAALGGLEAYGIGGMFVAVVLVTLVGAGLAELAEGGDLAAAVDATLAGDEPTASPGPAIGPTTEPA